jgi:hypothetical protein
MSEKVVWQLLQQYAAMVAFRVWLRTTSALSESTSACIRPEPTEWLFGRCRSLDAYGIVRSLPQSRNPNLQLGDEFKRSVPICFRRRSNDKQRASGKAIRWFVAKSTFSQPRDDRLRGVTEDKDYAASLVSERHPSAVNAFSCGIAAVPVQSCVAPQGANWSRSNCCSVISPSKRPSGICTRQDLGHAPNDGIKPRVAI